MIKICGPVAYKLDCKSNSPRKTCGTLGQSCFLEISRSDRGRVGRMPSFHFTLFKDSDPVPSVSSPFRLKRLSARRSLSLIIAAVVVVDD